MGIRYSYDDFMTKGHGVIEYADPHCLEEGVQIPKRSRQQSKFAVRWPSAVPIKKRPKATKLEAGKSLDKQASDIFKERFPGQQPKKGQIRQIKRDLLKGARNESNKRLYQSRYRMQNKGLSSTANIRKPNPKKIIDELSLAIFKRRFPGIQPKENVLKEIRQEVATARKTLGV